MGGLLVVLAVLLLSSCGSFVHAEAREIKDFGPTAGYDFVVDVSSAVDPNQWSCLTGNPLNASHAIVRAWRSLGSLDPNAAQTIANAVEAGFEQVDVYMFPCIKCLNFSAQVEEMLTGLEGSEYDRVWLDVEGAQYWTNECDTNLSYFETLLGILISRIGSSRVGVYTSSHSWNELMCGKYSPFSAILPLWVSRPRTRFGSHQEANLLYPLPSFNCSM